MTHIPYLYKQIKARQYFFVSVGRQRIAKVVEFLPLGRSNSFNLAFGDLRPDGSIDDKNVSNNGDIRKVLTTVIEILRQFTESEPDAMIYIEGSTVERTRLYTRILTTYYPLFSKEFSIVGIIDRENKKEPVLFEIKSDVEYFAFLIKRIN
jgi:hypothetical protein